jgi:predicted nucleic acid-binding protein
MISSPAHKVEISAISDDLERIDLLLLLEKMAVQPNIDKKAARMRAEDLVRQGLGFADAAHLAFAEASKADFISCDDKLIKKCFKVNLKIWAGNPVAFCDKEDLK